MTRPLSTHSPDAASAGIQSLNFFDSGALSEAVASSNFEHVQLERGCFQAELKHLDIGRLKVDSGCYTRKVLARGDFPTGKIIMGCVLKSHAEGSINGFRFRQNDVVIFPEGAELDYIQPAETTWCAVQFPAEVLSKIGCTEQTPGEIKVFPGNLQLTQLLACLVHPRSTELSTGVNKPTPTPPQQEEILTEQIGRVMNRYFGDDCSIRRPSLCKRMALIRQFEHIVRERLDTVVRIPELCIELGVGNRVLEYLFREELGMTPKQYSSLLRLNAVRHELLQKNAESYTVKQIANSVGITHLGRFATVYLHHFGEHPSDTLRR